MEILAKYTLEIIFGLISAGALAFCKYLWGRNKKLEEMQQADQNRQYRQMIIDEIEPIIEELGRIRNEINDVNTKVSSELNALESKEENEHKHMYQVLNDAQDENEKNFNLIINSYKFRLIQLCKTHLRDDYITESDFEQITEMYKLYHGLGGNGQAQEYYEKVLKLDVRPDEK